MKKEPEPWTSKPDYGVDSRTPPTKEEPVWRGQYGNEEYPDAGRGDQLRHQGGPDKWGAEADKGYGAVHEPVGIGKGPEKKQVTCNLCGLDTLWTLLLFFLNYFSLSINMGVVNRKHESLPNEDLADGDKCLTPNKHQWLHNPMNHQLTVNGTSGETIEPLVQGEWTVIIAQFNNNIMITLLYIIMFLCRSGVVSSQEYDRGYGAGTGNSYGGFDAGSKAAEPNTAASAPTTKIGEEETKEEDYSQYEAQGWRWEVTEDGQSGQWVWRPDLVKNEVNKIAETTAVVAQHGYGTAQTPAVTGGYGAAQPSTTSQPAYGATQQSSYSNNTEQSSYGGVPPVAGDYPGASNQWNAPAQEPAKVAAPSAYGQDYGAGQQQRGYNQQSQGQQGGYNQQSQGQQGGYGRY